MSAGDMAALEQTALAGIELDSRAIENYHEARLIERLRARELGAFEDLLHHFERPVYSLCFRLLGDAEEARDAAQETFLKVYRGLSGFRGEAGLEDVDLPDSDQPGYEPAAVVAQASPLRDGIA